jgi:hypothetical protein
VREKRRVSGGEEMMKEGEEMREGCERRVWVREKGVGEREREEKMKEEERRVWGREAGL